jgi:hypothetical protein
VRQHDETVVAEVPAIPFVLLTTALPSQGVGLRALRTARDAGLILDAVPMLSEAGQIRLGRYGAEGFDELDYPRDVMEFLVSDEPDALF